MLLKQNVKNRFFGGKGSKWKCVFFVKNFMVQNIPYLEACQKDSIPLKLRLSTKMELMQNMDIPEMELCPFVHVHAH